MDSCFQESEAHTVFNKEQCMNQHCSSNKQIFLYYNSNEEEIIQKLKVAPFEFTVKLAAAIGNVWQQSA